MAARSAPSAPPDALGVIAATKLLIPPARLELVPRDALVALVAGSPHTRLTLLSAPAGAGKTTLLTLWHRAAFESRPFAWLSLDESDNDPVRFWSCVIEALRNVAPSAGSAAEGALRSPRAGLEDVVLPLLINELATWEQPVVLVLDDLHAVEDSAVHSSLSYLLDHMPASLHLAVATRSDPDLPLPRLRAHDELIELRGGHLRFSAAEAAAFLNDGLGLGLADRDVAVLQQRTEGWAAGLQLAGLSLRSPAGARDVPASFTGDDRHVVDYLVSEVLDDLPEDLREFLRCTSILDRMCAELCEAIGCDERSSARLSELERRNLFTLAVDPERRWYRYHPLFADVLRRQLRESEPERALELHRRASSWWAQEGTMPDAIEHAIRGQDLEAAAELVASSWRVFFNRGWLATVAQWLRALPERMLREDFRLWLARAWTSLDVGALEEIEPWLETPVARGDAQRQAWADVLRALYRFKTGDVGAALAGAERAVADDKGGSDFWSTVATLVHGVAAFWTDRAPPVRAAFEDARRLASADGNSLAARYALGYLALDAAQRGLWAEARTHLAAGDALVEQEPPIDEHFTAMVSHLARGRLAEREGRLGPADAHVRRAIELSRRGAGAPEVAGALIAHAGVLIARGERDGVGSVLREASDVIARCLDPGRVKHDLDHVERRVARAQRSTQGAGDELSDSEDRVLRLLPSDLSLRQIGGDLYVSLNTVKTHTRHIYLKLGVGSREEAVVRARELGLL